MIPAHMKVHTVTIANYLGAGTYGETWDAPRVVACWLEETNKLVTSSTGEQVVSTTQVFVDPGQEGPLKSKITVSGVVRQLIGISRHTSGGLTNLDYVELMLK